MSSHMINGTKVVITCWMGRRDKATTLDILEGTGPYDSELVVYSRIDGELLMVYPECEMPVSDSNAAARVCRHGCEPGCNQAVCGCQD